MLFRPSNVVYKHPSLPSHNKFIDTENVNKYLYFRVQSFSIRLSHTTTTTYSKYAERSLFHSKMDNYFLKEQMTIEKSDTKLNLKSKLNVCVHVCVCVCV